MTQIPNEKRSQQTNPRRQPGYSGKESKTDGQIDEGKKITVGQEMYEM